MFSFRQALRLFALALNAIHQIDETWILVQVSPVRIRLKPLIVLVAETDGGFQPAQGFDLTSLQEVSRRQPVRNIVIGFGDLSHFRRELFVGLGVLTLRAETDRENRSHTIDLRALLQDLLKNL